MQNNLQIMQLLKQVGLDEKSIKNFKLLKDKRISTMTVLAAADIDRNLINNINNNNNN